MTTMDFIGRMVRFFPKKEIDKEEHIKEFGEMLSYVFVEDVIMPEVIELIKKSKDIVKIKEIFRFFEVVAEQADEELKNLFMISVLEKLGTEEELFEKSKAFMGPRTTELQKKANTGIGAEFLKRMIAGQLKAR